MNRRVSWLDRPDILIVAMLVTLFLALYIALQDDSGPLHECIDACLIEESQLEYRACLRGCLRYGRADGKF